MTCKTSVTCVLRSIVGVWMLHLNCPRPNTTRLFDAGGELVCGVQSMSVNTVLFFSWSTLHIQSRFGLLGFAWEDGRGLDLGMTVPCLRFHPLPWYPGRLGHLGIYASPRKGDCKEWFEDLKARDLTQWSIITSLENLVATSLNLGPADLESFVAVATTMDRSTGSNI